MKIVNIIEEKQFGELSKISPNANERSCIVFPDFYRREKRYGLGTSKDKPSRIKEIEDQVNLIKEKYYGSGDSSKA